MFKQECDEEYENWGEINNQDVSFLHVSLTLACSSVGQVMLFAVACLEHMAI